MQQRLKLPDIWKHGRWKGVILLLLLLCLLLTACGAAQDKAAAESEEAAEEAAETAAETDPASEEGAQAESSEPASAEEAAEQAEEILQESLQDAAVQVAAALSGMDMAELYPQAYATFSAMYEDNFSVDENGLFLMHWREPSTIDPRPYVLLPDTADYPEYTGTALSYSITGFDDYYLRYTLTNSTQETIRLDSGVTSLQIYLDGLWWDIEFPGSGTNSSSYNIDLEPGENEKLKFTRLLYCHYRVQGTGLSLAEEPCKLLPAGTYRLIWNLEPYDDSYLLIAFELTQEDREEALAAAADPSVIADCAVEAVSASADAQAAAETAEFLNSLEMSELFPEAADVLEELYGSSFFAAYPNVPDIFVLDWRDETDAADNPDSWPHTWLPDTTVYAELEDGLLTVSLSGCTAAAVEYELYNASDAAVSLADSQPVLQILLDGQWWEVYRKQGDAGSSVAAAELQPGSTSGSVSMLAPVQDAEDPVLLPVGTYRLIWQLEAEDAAYLTLEFELTEEMLAAMPAGGM